MIDEDYEYKYDLKDDVVDEMKNIRKNYNKKFVKICSNQYINRLNQNKKNLEFSQDLDDIKNYRTRVQYFKDYKIKGSRYDFEHANLDKIEKGLKFLESINIYINQQAFDQNELKYKVSELLKSIDEIDDKHQITSFFSDPIDEIFKNHKILLFDNFIIKGYSKTFFDLKNSATLIMEIVLPFWNKNYKETNVNCLTTDDLPYFYHNNK